MQDIVETPALGYVAGPSSTDSFYVVVPRSRCPVRGEYLVVRGVEERFGDQVHSRDLLCVVSQVRLDDRMLDTHQSWDELDATIRRELAGDLVVVLEVRPLGYLDPERGIVRPRGAPMPGSEVFRATNAYVQQFYAPPVRREREISLGVLLSRPGVQVPLDANGLRTHLAVLAVTGAGKSYTVGVILEQVLQAGGTILVLDPNSDYSKMRYARAEPGRAPRATPFSGDVSVYRLVRTDKLPADGSDPDNLPLSLRFGDLAADEICELAGVPSNATRIRRAIDEAVEALRAAQPNRDYGADDLLKCIRSLARGEALPQPTLDGRAALPLYATAEPPFDLDTMTEDEMWNTLGQERDAELEGEAKPVPEAETAAAVSARVQEGAEGAIYYVQDLMRLDIWGNDPPPIDDFLQPMHLSVLDVSGVGSKAAELVAQQVLARVWGRAKRRQLDHPVFIVLEEAHNFVSSPGRGGPGRQRCAGLIRTIASEGRKFGLFLILISQRPQKLDSDVLSQCVSKIVMRVVNPRDQTAIQEASEALSADLLADLPGLNRGEAVVMGPIVRAPALVRVGGRQSQDGGADIDVWEKLEAARAARQVRGHVEARRAIEATTGLPVDDPYA
jgi:hypothetical protein